MGNSILCKEGIPPVQHIKDLCLCIASTRHLQVQVVPFCARAGSYIPYSVCLQLVRVKADETAAINTGSMLIPDIANILKDTLATAQTREYSTSDNDINLDMYISGRTSDEKHTHAQNTCLFQTYT